MKHKPIRVDWDELEVAFTNHDEEIVYYLDLVTGHVAIDGEGEDDPYDEEEDFSPNAVMGGEVRAPDDGTRAYVKPMSTEMKLDWMRRFLEEKDNGLDAETNAKLREALESENPADVLNELLLGADEARDVWYLYRSDRLHEHMERWVEEVGVTPIDPPPWAEGEGEG